MTRDCLERCGRVALPGEARCAECLSGRERRRNAQPKRRAYRDPRYRAQPRHGVCWICGQPGADTRDHVVPIAEQMERWGQVRDHRTRPAHRACNSARGSRSWEGRSDPHPAQSDSAPVRVTDSGRDSR